MEISVHNSIKSFGIITISLYKSLLTAGDNFKIPTNMKKSPSVIESTLITNVAILGPNLLDKLYRRTDEHFIFKEFGNSAKYVLLARTHTYLFTISYLWTAIDTCNGPIIFVSLYFHFHFKNSDKFGQEA